MKTVMKRALIMSVVVALVASVIYMMPVSVEAASVYQVISIAKGASIDLKVKGQKIKKTTTSNKKIVAVASSKKGTITAKDVGTTTVTVLSSKGKKYKFKIKVFDQMSFMIPDYSGITKENYLDTLAKVKAKKDNILNCDKLVVMMDWYDGFSVDGDAPGIFDGNLIDLFSNSLDFSIEYAYDNDKAEWHSICLNTNWPGYGNYVDLSKTEKYFEKKSGRQTYNFTLSKKDSDKLRKAGTCWIAGNGYKLYKVTVSGKPIKEYDKMTATKDSPAVKSGKLHVEGTRLKDENGNDFRLLGGNLPWSQLGLDFYNSKTFACFNTQWGGNVVRIHYNTDYVSEDWGYALPTCNKAMVNYFNESAMVACIESGIYGFVEWAMFYNPLTYMDRAEEMYSYISKKYASVPNLIYDICNEPCDDENTPEKEDTWENIKEYCNKIIPIIRNNNPDAIIICGGPSWSNDLRCRMDDPLPLDNILYSDHIYEGHEHYDMELEAIEKGLALVITENSPTINDDKISAEDNEHYSKWHSIWDANNIGYSFQCLMRGDTNAIKNSCGKRWGWTEDDYTDVGKYVYHKMRKDAGLE